MSFTTVPIRKNSRNVTASWWNSLRTAGIQVEDSVSPGSNRNFILNSGFRFWQTGLDQLITKSGADTADYAADMVYTRNEMPVGSIIRIRRIAGVNSRYAYELTVDTSAGTSGEYLTKFPIPNKETNAVYGNSVVFRALVKAVGNVDRVGISLGYNTTETHSGVATIGSVTNFDINSSTFTEIFIVVNDTTVTTRSGMLWPTISPNRASTGDENDAGNGIIIEQPMLFIGNAAPLIYFPAYQDEHNEFNALQSFYEKSYNHDSAPSTVTSIGNKQAVRAGGTSGVWTQFKESKRSTPVVVIYSPATGNAGFYRDASTGTDISGSIIDAGEHGFGIGTSSGLTTLLYHFIADARIF